MPIETTAVPVVQTQLDPELVNWLKARQASLNIVKTTTTPSGQTIDWVPIASQNPSGQIATPPPAELARVLTAAPADRIAIASTFELDDPTIERGPAGTVPILRPDISLLSRFSGVQDLHVKRGGLLVNQSRPNRKPTDPNPAGYFHGTDNQNGTFYGWDGYLNMWDPAINIPAGGNGTDHSILQVWLQNYSTGVTQSLEGGWTVDQSLNGDTQPHVFTYYTTNGYASDGDNEGGYNTQYKGWIQYSPSVFPGIRINGTSTFDGTQYEISMKFQLYKEPNSNDVNWWVAVQGIWMGYYPATLYGRGLASEVQWCGSGGEVYSSLGNPEQTTDQMGSGYQADGGWQKSAYLRDLRVQTDMNGTMAENDGYATTDAASPGGADPYTIVLDMESGSSWDSYFFVGGPAAPPKPAATFNEIIFNIETGGDDLRGDSSATVTVDLPGGNQTFTLKAESDPGWGNNTDHVKSFTLSGAPQPLSSFGNITITLTSHNGFLETDDNWNIQSVLVTLSGSSGGATLMSKSGNPLARLTGSNPSVTLHA
jgi:Neprosin